MSDNGARFTGYYLERLEARTQTAQPSAKELLLRAELEKWQSHRAWSDRILVAYLDLMARSDNADFHADHRARLDCRETGGNRA